MHILEILVAWQQMHTSFSLDNFQKKLLGRKLANKINLVVLSVGGEQIHKMCMWGVCVCVCVCVCVRVLVGAYVLMRWVDKKA